MLINLSEFPATGFKLQEVLHPQLKAAARAGMRMRGAGLYPFQHMDPERFLLSEDDDTVFRS